MRPVRINGTLAPIPLFCEVDFDPVRGIVEHQEWLSAGDNLVGTANQFIKDRVAFHWQRSPVKSRLLATYSGGQKDIPDIQQANWQLLGNETQRSIFESGICLSGLQSFPSLVADVKSGFTAIEAGDSSAEQSVRDGLEDGEAAYYDQLIGFLTRGQTHFAQGQYVLKRSLSISNFYTGAVPGDGLVECLLSMGEILGYDMPPAMVSKAASIPIPISHDNYEWSWRQLPSTMTTQAHNRVEVSTEWWWDEWSTQLYQQV